MDMFSLNPLIVFKPGIYICLLLQGYLTSQPDSKFKY
jgi:hypothetical protein